MTPNWRFRLLFSSLCLATAWAILAFTLSKGSSSSSLPDSGQHLLDLLSGWPSSVDDGYCTPGQLANGKWKQKSKPLSSIDELKLAYNMPENMYERGIKCQAIELFNDTTARTLSVASWDWIPEGGCLTRQWTPIKFAIRFLRSPNGFVSVGDSLSHQAFDLLWGYFNYPDTPFLYDHRGSIYGSISLKPDHPLTSSILQMAGVDQSRLASPFAIFYRHHHLLSQKEAAEMFPNNPAHHMGWKLNEPDWWPLFLEEKAVHQVRQNLAANALSPDQLVINRKQERDVVSVQVGAHWTKAELGPDLTSEELVDGYRNMASFVSSRLSEIDPPANVLWRAVGPGHCECNQYLTAEPERTDIYSTENPARVDYNWALMPDFNEILKEQLNYKPDTRPSPPRLRAKTTLKYVDIWPMAIQRPEAHPGWNDCLHFCPVGVMTGWHDQFWHNIVQDSIYSDY